MDWERIGKGEKEEKGKKVGDPVDSRGQRHLNARVITRAGGGCALRFSHEPPSLPPPHRTGHSSADESERRTGDAFFVSIVRLLYTGWPGIYFRGLYIILTKGGNSLPLIASRFRRNFFKFRNWSRKNWIEHNKDRERENSISTVRCWMKFLQAKLFSFEVKGTMM